MSGERFYKLFGITRDASEEEIKSAYKKLAKIHHPDKNKSPKAVEKFQEIQEAYTYLLQQVKQVNNAQNVSFEDKENITEEKEEEEVDEWTSYRQKAWRRYQEKQKKQALELENWYLSLRKGWQRSLFLSIVIVACTLNLLFTLDFFLPSKIENDRVSEYSEVLYKSMDNHPVSVIETENKRTLWLNNFNNAYFNRNPFIKIKTTAILHHPVEVLVESEFRIYHIPVHFNLYWAQLLIQAILFIPLFFLFYKKNDAYFIMGHYTTVFLIGSFILYILLTENRLIHILTLGYF
jgi:curved DNA-binding protein CbpA